MDGQMIDPSLDRDIESLLAVEPSPEFVARVRARIAEEPAPGRWWMSWMFAAAGAAAVVIAVLIARPSSEPALSKAPQPSPQMARAAGTAAAPASPTATATERRVAVATRAIARTVSSDRAIEIDLPDVVIADNEVKTFASLVASVRQRRFDAAIPAASNPDTPLEIRELPPLEPLEIEPIVQVAALHAEGERP